ncbi:hypothetical protein QTJ16_003065 [Diplocarpon rosae]|uniref:USP domain-containing protein n=1 Tax=Diplocarpon rosae TaxID=946125 RepID=A0AAD9T1Z2_9HELO|nr:hypothetical protein QTJ16_003065 [Diplocarpon rosae]
MSPTATGGPPYTRALSFDGGPISTANGTNMNGTDGLKGGNRVFPHLDDLVAVGNDADMIHWPIRRLLQEGETLAKQADTHLDFRRPDLALQEYIKATTIAVEYVPRHKDYPSLQADRGELHRLHVGLNKRINGQHRKFADVKEVIKENNARSGVKPSSSLSTAETKSAVGNGHFRTQAVPEGPGNGNPANGTTTRKKAPAVQPKPDALHGKSIESGRNVVDLASRFARLRSPERANSVQQDPRINTQPIVVPASFHTSPVTQETHSRNSSMSRSTGPREMPSVPRTIPRHANLPLDTAIPAMPRAPDAIYSPAIENATTINLPSSIARSSSYFSHGRKTSAPPVSTVGPTPDLNESRKDYFSSPRTMPENGHHQSSSESQFTEFADASTITAEQLMKHLSQSVSILIVDLRSRGEFDSGHIMSQSVICVEPITLRPGISGEQLGDSMVIASDSDQALYDRRADFDLIVYYDQSSKAVSTSSSTGRDTNSILRDFSAAVFDYGYEKQVKRRPLLLVGGLDAWVDLLGPNSLESSSTKLVSAKTSNFSSSVGRFNLPEKHLRRMGRMNTRSSRLLSRDEETKWDLALKHEAPPSSPGSEDQYDLSEFIYAKTVEGFLNKYPEMPVIQESMVSQPPAAQALHTTTNEFESNIPQLPTRPAPALPRQRSSGISDNRTVTTFASGTSTISTVLVPPGLTGLRNPKYLCYMNSSIQALSATPFIRNLIRNFSPDLCPAPRRPEETSDPPQLLVRFMSNLYSHMWSGQYDFLGPTSLAKYINTVHFKSPEASASNIMGYCYGGVDRQHDASEFLFWLLSILDDEINPQRNLRPDRDPVLAPNEVAAQAQLPLIAAAQYTWPILMKGQASVLTQRLKVQDCRVMRCTECGTESRNFSTYMQVNLPLTSSRNTNLQSLLADAWGPGASVTLTDIECDSEQCKREANWQPLPLVNGKSPGLPRRNKTSTTYLTRLPDYMMITLGRFLTDATGTVSSKNQTVVSFPERGLDMRPYFAPNDSTPEVQKDSEHRGPFIYDVYAVQQHSGNLSSGHYVTLARSPDIVSNDRNSAGSWHKFNDTQVTPCNFAETQSAQSYILYLKKRGSPN